MSDDLRRIVDESPAMKEILSKIREASSPPQAVTDLIARLAEDYWEADTDEDTTLFAERPVEWLTRFGLKLEALLRATPADSGLAETERLHSADCRRQEEQRQREADALQAGFKSATPEAYRVEPDSDGGEWHVLVFPDGHSVYIFTEKPLVIVEAERQ